MPFLPVVVDAGNAGARTVVVSKPTRTFTRFVYRLLRPALAFAIVVTSAADFAGGGFLSQMSDGFWTYVVLGLSSIITEELAPIFGGIAAHEGELQLERVILAITFGGWVATTLLYGVGRLKWEVIRRRWPRTRATGTIALRVVARNPVTASFLVRMAFGLRIVLPLACGAARVPVPIYLPASLLGSALWSTLFTLLGYAAGEAAVQVVGKLGRVGEIVGAILVTALVFAFVWWRRKRIARKERRRSKRASAQGASDMRKRIGEG